MKRTVIYSLMAALLLAVVAIFFFYPDDVEGRVMQQSDLQQGKAIGHEGEIWKEQTGEQPRWTNALFSGMPTYQISPSYPSDAALKWVQGVYTLWLPAPANLLFGMMIGFFIMCLCMGIKWSDSLFGAIAWGLSTYFIIIIGAGHLWKFMALMYIPPTIGGIALLYRGKYLGGLAVASLFGSLQLMSNHPQMSYYFMIVILCMVLAWLWSAVKHHATARWGIATGCMVLAGVVALAVNSPSLYNTYSYSKQTIRGNATELPPMQGEEVTTNGNGGLSLDYMTHWSYGKGETFSLLIPNVKGGASVKPAEGSLAPATLAETEKAEELYNNGVISPMEYQLLQAYPQYFGEQPGTNGPVYVGAFVLVLALLAMFVVKGPMKWALFVASILAIMLSWGSNMMWFTEWWANNIHGYNRFRTVSSILVIVEFTLPLLAVLCLVQMSRKDGREHFRKNPWLYYGVMGLPLLICLIGWMSPSVFGSGMSGNDPDQMWLAQNGVQLNDQQFGALMRAVTQVRMDMVSADCMRSFCFIALGCAVVFLYLFNVIKRPKVMVLAVAALTLIDLFTVNGRYVNSESFNEPLEAQEFVPTQADLAILKDTGYYRVADMQDFMGYRSSYFHKTVGGYHAAKLTRYNDLLTHQIATPQGPNMAVLNMLNTKYFMAGDQYERNPQAMGNAWFVNGVDYVKGAKAEMIALDSLDVANKAVADQSFSKILGTSQPKTPGDTITLSYYSPDKLSYNARTAKGGVAVFSEVYFPDGWEATIDGKPAEIGRVNYVLRALNVPAGNHHIEFVFAPKALETTNTLSVVGVILVYLFSAGALALVVLHILRKRKKAAAEEETAKETPAPKKAKAESKKSAK